MRGNVVEEVKPLFPERAHVLFHDLAGIELVASLEAGLGLLLGDNPPIVRPQLGAGMNGVSPSYSRTAKTSG